MACESAPVFQPPSLGDNFDDGTMPEPKEMESLPYSFNRQEVFIDVDFLNRGVSGKSEIWFTTFDSNNLPDIRIDARQCEIDIESVTIEIIRDGQRLKPINVPAEYKDPCDLLDYPEGYLWEAGNHDLCKLRMLSLIETRNSDSPADSRDLIVYRPLDGALKVKISKELFRKPGIIKLKASDEIEHHDFVLSIPYKSTKIRDGFQFVGVEEGDARYPHMYTRHSSEPGIASSIFPCIDDPGTLCDWKIHVTCPKTLGHALRPTRIRGGDCDWRYNNLTDEDKLLDINVVCTGSKTDQIDDPNDDTKYITSFTTESRTISADKVAFAVGPFEHVDLWTQFRTDEDDDKMGTSAIRVHGFCLPGRADEVQNTCAPMSMAADFLTINYSAYPFESFKMCFVDDLLPDTVPQCSLAFISNRLLYPDDIIDTEIETTEKLVYSLAAQWSGIQMFPNMRSDTWVTTGLAWFMTDTFMRKLCGNNDHRFRIKTAVDHLVEIDVDRPSLHEVGKFLHLGTFEQDFLALKSRLVMFVLDKRLIKASGGSTGLTRIMSRLFLKARMASNSIDKVVSTESFRKICEKLGRSKLEAFWKEWIFGTGCPKLEVTPRFNKKRLCIEMTIRQTHTPIDEPPRYLQKEEFLRVLVENRNGVIKNAPPQMFTGPITIRIHEADGTPYEHIVEIRDDAGTKRATKFEIAYNTKYKRLKRTRRMKEKQTAAGKDENTGDDQEVLLYSLGDILQTPAEVETFMVREWDEAAERQMDSESYEWIRMDTDFEWIGFIRTNMPGYMYISQLQQDRDVVAQEDTLLYIRRERPHPVASTFLVRTLMDTRYFHGIRTMAAQLLQLQATEQNDMRGMVQLMEAFCHFFCYQGTKLPKPNDFTNKQQYRVQKTIPMALAQVRDKRGKCPMQVQSFLLDLLLYNNNSDNQYSDHYYVATLITAVATAFVNDKRDEGAFYIRTSDDDLRDSTEKEILQRALEQINRFLRMDEWTNSYHNLWTLAGLDAKRLLMKAGVIPTDAIDFVQYLQDETFDEVRIKAFESLVDLGLMAELPIFRLLLSCLSTDRSPYVRDKLMKAFAHGLAGIAFGDTVRPKPNKKRARKSAGINSSFFLGGLEDDAEAQRSDSILAIDGMDIDVEPETDNQMDGLVVIENTHQEMEARKAMFARKQNLDDAVAALRKEFEEHYSDIEADVRRAVWKAVNSPVLGIAEKLTLLELCSIMFDESDRFILTLKYPRGWTVSRPPKVSGRCMVSFKPYFRTEPRKPIFTVKTQVPPTPSAISSGIGLSLVIEQTPLSATPTATKKLIINRSGSISLKSKPTLIKPMANKTPLKATISTLSSRPTISLSIKHDTESKSAITASHLTNSPTVASAPTPLIITARKRSVAELDNIYDTPAPKSASSTTSNKRPLEIAEEETSGPKRIRVDPKLRVSVRRAPQQTPTAPERLIVTFKSRTLRHACAHKGIAPPRVKHTGSNSSSSSLSSAAASPAPKIERERAALPDSPRHSLPDSSTARDGSRDRDPTHIKNISIPRTSSSTTSTRPSIKIPSKISLKTHASASPARTTASPRASPGPPTLKSLMTGGGTPKPGRKPLPGGGGGSGSPSARTPHALAGSKHGRDGQARSQSPMTPGPSTPGGGGGGGGGNGNGTPVTTKPRIKIMLKKPSAPPPS